MIDSIARLPHVSGTRARARPVRGAAARGLISLAVGYCVRNKRYRKPSSRSDSARRDRRVCAAACLLFALLSSTLARSD